MLLPVRLPAPWGLSWARQLATLIGLAGLYLVFGLASFSTDVTHAIVTPVCFLPEGIALGAALLIGPGIWPGVFLGQLLLALSRSVALPVALAIAAINSLEAVIAGLLFRRLGLQADLGRLKDLGGLLLLIVLVLQPFSATLGTTTLVLTGNLAPGPAQLESWLNWWVGNSMGQALLTPLLLSVFAQRHRRKRLLAGAALSLLVVLPIGWLIIQLMGSRSTTLMLVVATPALVYLAVRVGLAGVSAGSLALTLTALTLTARGVGPFVNGSRVEILDLNVFVLGLGITGQFLAVLFQERQQMEQQLRQLAYYDPLTQLPNRRLFYEKLNALEHRSDSDFGALILLDLDQFKEINDNHGHDVGDLLLIEVAARLSSFASATTHVGRLGGDEFVVLLEDLGPEPESAGQRASAIAERICQRLQEPYRLGAITRACSASYGLQLFAGEAVSSRQILKQADIAMYEAKKGHRRLG